MVAKALDDSDIQCLSPPPPSTDFFVNDEYLQMKISLLAWVGVACVMCAVYWCVVTGRLRCGKVLPLSSETLREPLSQLPSDLEDTDASLQSVNDSVDVSAPSFDISTGLVPFPTLPPQTSWCLGASHSVPGFVQYAMPAALFLNAAVFVGSNFATGASIVLVAKLGDERIASSSLFDFTLSNSVRDMWDAGVYPLSLIILIFSGIWPYVKIVAMLICWWIPSSYLPAGLRERMLMVLDSLGKVRRDSSNCILLCVVWRVDLLKLN